MGDPVRLRLPGPESGLRLRPGPHGSTLVCPSKGKHDWDPSELVYRSVLVAEDGRVLSIGFDKFFTLGERSAETTVERLRGRLSRGEPVAVHEKLDGSLIVRSVIADRVLLRTRGTVDPGAHVRLAEALAAERHPVLLDPARFADESLLLELTTCRGELQVVVEHAEDRLRLLAARRHEDLRFAREGELDRIAVACGLERPPSVSTTDLDELVRHVGAWPEGREGVVLSAEDEDAPSGRSMLKLKSHRYLAAHRLLDDVAGAGLVDFFEERAIERPEDAWVAVEALGLPRARLAGRAWVVDAYLRESSAAEDDLDAVRGVVTAAREQAALDGLDGRAARKALASRVLGELADATRRAAAFAVADGRAEQALGLLRRSRLDGLRGRLRDGASGGTDRPAGGLS